MRSTYFLKVTLATITERLEPCVQAGDIEVLKKIAVWEASD